MTYCFKHQHCLFSKRISNYVQTSHKYCKYSNSLKHAIGIINTVLVLTLPPSHIWSEFRLNLKGGPVQVSVGPSFVTHKSCHNKEHLRSNMKKFCSVEEISFAKILSTPCVKFMYHLGEGTRPCPFAIMANGWRTDTDGLPSQLVCHLIWIFWRLCLRCRVAKKDRMSEINVI